LKKSYRGRQRVRPAATGGNLCGVSLALAQALA